MIIALDMDGVIADIIPEFQFRLKRDFNITKPAEEWSTHYIAKEFEEVPEKWVDTQLADPTFWMNAICFEDAWFMINKWFMSGHDIFIVTCRGVDNGPRTLEISEAWLDQWEIPYNRIFADETRLEKYKTCQKIGASFLVEDDPHEVLESSKHIPAYLIERPYNSLYDIGRGQRIANLSELDQVVMGENKQVQDV